MSVLLNERGEREREKLLIFAVLLTRLVLIVGEDIIETEMLSLLENGILTNVELFIEKGKVSTNDVVIIRVVAVSGNDRSPKYNAAMPGTRGKEVELEIPTNCTIRRLRELAGTALLDLPEGWTDSKAHKLRLRNTIHLGDPGEILLEVNEKNASILLTVTDAKLMHRPLLLLEEGEVPIKGMLDLSIVLWLPHLIPSIPPDAMPQPTESAPASTAADVVDLSQDNEIEILDDTQTAIVKEVERARERHLVYLSSLKLPDTSTLQTLHEAVHNILKQNIDKIPETLPWNGEFAVLGQKPANQSRN